MSSKLSALVEELSRLSLQRYPDLPASMYIERCDPGKLSQVVGFEVPDDLKRLYGTANLVTEPWQRILLSRPSVISDECAQYNEHLRTHSPPLRAESGVQSSVIFGAKLIPFGYYDDSVYCIDVNPHLQTGGLINQVVNVSLRKGIAKVAFPSLEAFLEDGLKKMKREIKREQSSQGKGATLPEISSVQKVEAEAMLSDALAYFKEALAGLPIAARLNRVTSTAEAERRVDVQKRVQALTASNPRQTSLQRVCAELLQLYANDSQLGGYVEETLPPMPRVKREKIQHALSLTLPADLQELLEAHQRVGVSWDNVVTIGVEDNIVEMCKELRSIKVPVDAWGLWPGTATPDFGKGLLPLGGDGDPVICYDLQPGPGGVVGQLVKVSFEEATCRVIASSLLEFVSAGLQAVRAGVR